MSWRLQIAFVIAILIATGSKSQAWNPAGGTWPGNPAQITYSYSNLFAAGLGGGLDDTELRLAVEEALNVWAMHAPLVFIEVADSGPAVSDTDYNAAGHPRIRIGHHSITGTAYAHAWSPPGAGYNIDGLGGDVHLDSGTSFGLYTGTDVLGTLIHEIGHSLGSTTKA